MSSQTPYNQLEREYFVRKLGSGLPTTPTNAIKRDYIISIIGVNSPVESLDSLEKRWLQKIADTAGYTPANDFSDLWKQAVMSIGETPCRMMTQNKRIFFSIAP